jgi:hypothetical protein
VLRLLDHKGGLKRARILSRTNAPAYFAGALMTNENVLISLKMWSTLASRKWIETIESQLDKTILDQRFANNGNEEEMPCYPTDIVKNLPLYLTFVAVL